MTITDKLDFSKLEVINVDKDLPDINEPYILQMKIEGVEYEFAGVMLAEASSQADTHRDHPDSDTAPKGVKCSACRWLEVEIYRKYPDQGKFDDTRDYIYVVVTRGPSIVPDERDYEKISFTESEYEVAELLTVRKTRGTQSTFMPPQHARALAQAAAHDAKLREVYRTVVA